MGLRLRKKLSEELAQLNCHTIEQMSALLRIDKSTMSKHLRGEAIQPRLIDRYRSFGISLEALREVKPLYKEFNIIPDVLYRQNNGFYFCPINKKEYRMVEKEKI